MVETSPWTPVTFVLRRTVPRPCAYSQGRVRIPLDAERAAVIRDGRRRTQVMRVADPSTPGDPVRPTPPGVVDFEALLLGPGERRSRPARPPGPSSPWEHAHRLTPAVLTVAVALDVLVALAPALLPGGRGSATSLTFLVPPSVVIAGWGRRGWIATQMAVVVASCGALLATAPDPSVQTAAAAIGVAAAVLAGAVVVVVLRRALERAAAEARVHATIDPLTAAVNRRGLEDAAVALLQDGRGRA